MWCIPQLNEEYIERMEDILTLYNRPSNAKEPVVCLDEKPIQLLKDARPGLIKKNGIRRVDHEYRRLGTANIFCAIEPKAGRHFVQPTLTRKRTDFARMLAQIAKSYNEAETIHLVVDNLNTHRESALIEAFGEANGKALWARFTVHYTPKHASWLNQAEIQIGLVSRECLGKRRLGTFERIVVETATWCRRANRLRRTIDWKFTVRKARAKFGYASRP
jgi:hypothetical protein